MNDENKKIVKKASIVFNPSTGTLIILGSDASSDSGNMYPTDGFKISGKFTSETCAEGTISYSRMGETYESTGFTANK